MIAEQIIAQQKAEIANLKFRLKQLENLIFGAKRERFIPTQVDPSQLNLFDTESIDAAPVPLKTERISYERKKKSSHPGRNPIPEHLPVQEVVIEPQGVQDNWVKIGEEITETVDYTPASLIKKRLIRPKYSNPDTQQITIAEIPDRSMPKCIAEPGLIAHLINRKFVEHMPFYRQIAQIKRDYQWEISSSTVGNWFAQACDLLTPLYNALRAEVLDSTYIQVDESPIKVLDSDKPQATHQGYQWVYHGVEQRLILFDYRKGRGKAGPQEILRHYRGIIQCDGWQVYDRIAASRPDITLAGCLAHARRKFYEAKHTDSQRSHDALSMIKKLYMLEREAKQSSDRYSYRQTHMLPILQSLKQWADQQALIVLPKSAIGKALTYLIKQYHKLETIFTDGRIELDNNLIENKIRPLALGRKNYLFAGSHQGAKRIAIMYSFMASCQANDINPYLWLKKVLSSIHDTKLSELYTLLPNYK